MENSRRRESCSVTCPAQAFAALGAVCGNVQVIIPLAPDNILLQAVNPGIGTAERPYFLQIAGQMAGGQLNLLVFLQTLQANIPETVECEMRPQDLFFTVKNIGIRSFGKTQVFRIEITVLIQAFRVAENNSLPRMPLNFHFRPAGQVLAKVKDPLSVRGDKILLHRKLQKAADRFVFLGDQ